MYWYPEVGIYTEIYPNLKSISELWKVSIRLYNWVSCNQTLGCLRLYGDSRVSRAQPRSMHMRYCCRMIGCYFFSRQNRFAETDRHLQLSYHITDRLLAAGNKVSIVTFLNQSANFFYLSFFLIQREVFNFTETPMVQNIILLRMALHFNLYFFSLIWS